MRLVRNVFLGAIFIVIGGVGVFAIAYNLFQDKIQSKITSVINETIDGSVELNKLEYTLFSSYPNLDVTIDTLVLYENDSVALDKLGVLGLNELHLTVDAWQAYQGSFVIGDLSFLSGWANIITYADSSINILKAVNMVNANDLEEGKDEEANLFAKLDNISITNMSLSYKDELSNQSVFSSLNELNANVVIDDDSLIAIIDFAYNLDSFLIDDKRILKNQLLAYRSQLNADLSKSLWQINSGKLKLNLLEANMDGSYNGENNGFVDVNIWAKHTDLAELAQMEIFKEENLPELKNGELELKASVKGYTVNELPLVNGNLSLKNLEVYNKYGKVVDDVSFALEMKSLSTQNFNDSHLTLDSLSVHLTSGGYVKAGGVIQHLDNPEFSLFWEASEQLENIDKLVEVPNVLSMKGTITTKGNYAGNYNFSTNKLSKYKGALNIKMANTKVVLAQNNYPINNINGTVYMVNGDVGFENLSLIANDNKMKLNGKIEHAIPFVFGEQTELTGAFSVISDSIKTETLLAFDQVLADSNKYSIRDVNINLQAELMSNALDNYKLFPTGNLTVYNFTALVDGAPPITQFSGRVEADQKHISMSDFNGVIGKSKVNFSVNVTNYNDFFQSETKAQMVLDVALKSEQINVKDFFTVNHKFILPKNYEQEVLKEVAVNAKVITTNFELQKKQLLPEFELQVSGLKFRTLYTPVIFKDIFVFGLVKDNNVYVNSMFGKFGRSDVFMNAQFDNVIATKDTVSRPLKSRVTFNSGVLDLDELIKLDELDSTTQISTGEEETASNPFAEKYPITDFQLNIGELTYFGAIIKKLKGRINIEENNIVHMNHVSLQSGEYGSFEFDGDLDASSRKEAILKSTIKISDVDLSKLNVTYIQNEEEVKISDHFQGQVNGEIIANVPIMPDFNFDLGRLIGKVKVKLTNGSLVNYGPLEEMGAYFKNKDLNKVRFDTLKNTMIFNSGKMLLPFMTLNTTLGTINLMGFQSLNNDMEYDIQVPIKLVAGSALNSLFASKKGDDKKEDTIKKAGKSKYVTVHISGRQDVYKFKLGKKHVLSAPPGFKVD